MLLDFGARPVDGDQERDASRLRNVEAPERQPHFEDPPGRRLHFMTPERLPAARRGPAFQARLPGKLVTVLQLATFIGLLIRPTAALPMIAVVAVVSLWAIADYTWMLHKARAR